MAVAAGAEVRGIDIVVAFAHGSIYAVSGRAIDGDSGAAYPRALVGIFPKKLESGAADFAKEVAADEQGVFHAEGLAPGAYTAVVLLKTMDQSPDYSGSVSFVIADRDAEGIVVPVYDGVTIRGRVVVEGSAPPDLADRLTRLTIRSTTEPPTDDDGDADPYPLYSRISNVDANGDFRLMGIKTGVISLDLESSEQPLQHTWLRMENAETLGRDSNGVIVRGDVTDLRLVIAFGSGAMKGRVHLIDGLGPAAGAMVYLNCVGALEARAARANELGEFRVDHLVPGEYVVRARTSAAGGQTRVTVASEAIVDVNVTVEPTRGQSTRDFDP
ncbi:MAG: carboxypeptidase-like regulatory domain-containing protein [Blastocatellia bacterium]